MQKMKKSIIETACFKNRPYRARGYNVVSNMRLYTNPSDKKRIGVIVGWETSRLRKEDSSVQRQTGLKSIG